MPKLIKFLKICAEVLVPKFIRAKVRLPVGGVFIDTYFNFEIFQLFVFKLNIKHSSLLLALVKVMTELNKEQHRFKLQCNKKIERHRNLENQAVNEVGFQMNAN